MCQFGSLPPNPKKNNLRNTIKIKFGKFRSTILTTPLVNHPFLCSRGKVSLKNTQGMLHIGWGNPLYFWERCFTKITIVDLHLPIKLSFWDKSRGGIPLNHSKEMLAMGQQCFWERYSLPKSGYSMVELNLPIKLSFNFIS